MKVVTLIKRIVTWVGSSILTVAALLIAINVLGGSTVGEATSFFMQMLRNPIGVGALAPTSNVTAAAMVAHIPAHGGGRRLLEVGAGTGAITQELLKKVQPGDVVDLVELEEELAEVLQRKFGDNPQVNIINMSITDWQPDYQYDAMVMSVPLAILPRPVTQSIWEHCQSLLKPGAQAAYISYIGFPIWKQYFLFGDERKAYKENLDYLADFRRQYMTSHKEVMANLPPAYVYYLTF